MTDAPCADSSHTRFNFSLKSIQMLVILAKALVERLIAIQGSNRAFCDTSMKFGTQVEQAEANIFRNRAIADLAHGCHGNHFKVLFSTKTHKT